MRGNKSKEVKAIEKQQRAYNKTYHKRLQEIKRQHDAGLRKLRHR